MKIQTTEENKIRRNFLISVFIKGAISFAEIVAGLILFFIPISFIINPLLSFSFVSHYLQGIINELTAASGTFIAIYLLSRGLIKFLLIIALLKDKLWAYPSSLAVLGLFVLYQIYQIITTHSIAIVLITIFDLFVMWSIWREYILLKDKKVFTSL